MLAERLVRYLSRLSSNLRASELTHLRSVEVVEVMLAFYLVHYLWLIPITPLLLQASSSLPDPTPVNDEESKLDGEIRPTDQRIIDINSRLFRRYEKRAHEYSGELFGQIVHDWFADEYPRLKQR